MASSEQQIEAVTKLREAITSRPWIPLGEMRKRTSHDPPAGKDVWIARTTLPAPPEDDLRKALYAVIECLKSQVYQDMGSIPADDVGIEFIGPRKVVDSPETEEPASDAEQLKVLEQQCDPDSVILFLHGGAFIFSGPWEYRGLTTRLAKRTGVRVASIRQRLAPTDPWPSQLLDVLVAYANLLFPPEGAIWSAVKPEKLVLVGSSSGANLGLAFIKLLLELRKDSVHSNILFHGRSIRLPLPAGMITTSGWFDLCESLPSNFSMNNDIIPDFPMSLRPSYPSDAIWPSNPPREHTYSYACNLDHPLISPVAVADWSGASPILLVCGGEERMLDCNYVVTSQLAKSGVQVNFHQYEGMPHEFGTFLRKLPQSAHYLELCASVCLDLLAGKYSETNTATHYRMPDCKAEDLGSPARLSNFDHEQLCKEMQRLNRQRKVYFGSNKPRM